MKSKKLILLVDDDTPFRFAMATELRTLGYLVLCAENGDRAIRMIRESKESGLRFDLVITDLVMPKKDGMLVCREIREIFKDLPVLVITGFMSAETEKLLQEMGCNDYMEKPFSPMEMMQKVEMLLADRGCGL